MKLETLLEEEGIHYVKTKHAPTYTAQSMAAEEHVSGYFVAKPVIVKGDKHFAMCVVPACARINLDRVGEVLQVLDIRLATEEEMAALFPDCELGAEPAIGKLYGMKTLIDERLHQDDHVVMQAGTHTESVRIERGDWERLCDPIVADITH